MWGWSHQLLLQRREEGTFQKQGSVFEVGVQQPGCPPPILCFHFCAKASAVPDHARVQGGFGGAGAPRSQSQRFPPPFSTQWKGPTGRCWSQSGEARDLQGGGREGLGQVDQGTLGAGMS